MGGWEGGRAGKGKGEQAGYPVAAESPPGVGAALNSLPQLPGCPQLPKAQIRGAGCGGRRRSQDARPLHSHTSQPLPACPGGSARRSSRGLAAGVWGGPEGAFVSETPPSLAHHVLSAGLCSKPPLASPAALPECERFKARPSR